MKIHKNLLIIFSTILIIFLSSCNKKFTTYEAGMLAMGGVIFCIGIFIVISFINYPNKKEDKNDELL